MKISKLLFVLTLITLVLVSHVHAEGLSLQLKRTNPGIAGEKAAEIIFDVVNTDMTHKLEGFIWCRSPDDVTISSTMGAASGSGAQYVSQKFFMDEGPSQRAISLVIDADTAGDKRTGCIVKYAPYTEDKVVQEDTAKITKEVTEEAISFSDVEMKMIKRNESDIIQTFLVLNDKEYLVANGDLIKFGDLEIAVKKVEEENIKVDIAERTESTDSQKSYLTMNGLYVGKLKDSQYREIRLDKTIPFVEAPKTADVRCPEGQTYCKSDEVEVSETKSRYYIYAIVAGLLAVLLILVYLVGKGSKGKTSVRNEFNDYRKNDSRREHRGE